MIRLLIAFVFLYVNFCFSQNRPTEKEFLEAIKDSLPSDKWRICNVDNSFHTKDTLYLFKRVLTDGVVEEGKQYDNCCNIISWDFVNSHKMYQYEEGWCGNIIKGIEISSEKIKFKVIEEEHRTILRRFWKNKLIDSYLIADIKNVTFEKNRRSKLITLVRLNDRVYRQQRTVLKNK